MSNNFKEVFSKGQTGGNIGVDMGLDKVNAYISGLHPGHLIGIAASPKTGKSTMNLFMILNSILHCLKTGRPFNIKLYSFETRRIDLEFQAACFFLYNFYDVPLQIPISTTYRGKNFVSLSADYLSGRVMDDNGEVIKVEDPLLLEKIKDVYNKRIVPFFGVHNSAGIQLKEGHIHVIEKSSNPTGIRNSILQMMDQYGNFTKRQVRKSIVYDRFTPHNPDIFHLISIDHIRKLKEERGFNEKQLVDKLIEYQGELKRLCPITFIDVVHLNRNITDVSRLKYAKESLYPTSDDIKGTGNLAEECDHLFTMFNPNDDRYSLAKHFGVPLRDPIGNALYPNLRTIHLVESRHRPYPQHFRVNMMGGVKTFENFKN